MVETLERIELPIRSLIAARVEGRSRVARLGLAVHVTAPTIHLGFCGHIALEIVNHGPFTISLRSRESRICQLIFERVGKEPVGELEGPFQGQSDVIGL